MTRGHVLFRRPGGPIPAINTLFTTDSYCSYKGGEGEEGGGGLHFIIHIEKMVSRLNLQVKTS
jgi:hypothetical protein